MAHSSSPGPFFKKLLSFILAVLLVVGAFWLLTSKNRSSREKKTSEIPVSSKEPVVSEEKPSSSPLLPQTEKSDSPKQPSFIGVKSTVPSPAIALGALAYLGFENSPEKGWTKDIDGKALAQLLPHPKANPPKSTQGAIGNGWDFADSNSLIAIRSSRLRSLGNIDTQEGLTISLWLKHKKEQIKSNMRIGGAGDQWEIINKTKGVIQFKIGGHELSLPGNSTSDNGQWHHYVVTADYHSNTQNIQLYMDGEKVSSASSTFSTSFSEKRADHSTVLAARPGKIYETGLGQYPGSMDEFAIFDRPLSPKEVSQLFQHNGDPITLTIPRLDLGPSIAVPKQPGVNTCQLNAQISNCDLNAEGTSIQWEVIKKAPHSVHVSAPFHSEKASFSNPYIAHPKFTVTPGEGDYSTYRLRCKVITPQTTVNQEISVSFFQNNTPETRSFSALPEPGIHPRLFFTPQDLPAMRENFALSRQAKKASEYIKNELIQMRKKEAFYQAMFAGDESFSLPKKEVIFRFNEVLANSAAVALMENDESQLQLLGKAVSFFAISYLPHYETPYANYLTHDADARFAYCYDWLYSYLSEEGREAMRTILSKMSRYRNAFGSHTQPHLAAGNWDTRHDTVVLCALAIEGEKGYDPYVFESNTLKLRQFLTQYGLHQNGFAHEGDGYLNFGMETGSLMMLATAHRDENFFQSTRFYKNVEAKFREIQPWFGGDMYSHHDGQGWGTGYFLGNIFWVTSYVFPNDPLASYNNQAYVESAGEDRKKRLACVLFAQPFLNDQPDPQEAAAKRQLALSVAEPERGLVNVRSDWSEDALRLDFECRMDLYATGHIHTDRNMFTLSALGRQWVTDQGYHETPNDLHATVLIDGIGQPGSKVLRWKSMPGIFLDYQDQNNVMTASGDARISYSYHNDSRHQKPDPETLQQAPKHLRSSLDQPANEIFHWSDFVMPGRVVAEWKKHAKLENVAQYNPVQRAFRSVALVRGKHPYVLVVDDIQKDDLERVYEWSMPTSNLRDKTHGKIIVERAHQTEAILRYEKDTEKGSPRLLVRVLQGNGKATPALKIDSKTLGVYGKNKRSFDRLIVQRKTVSPHYKILLYPFRAGEPLPKTSVNENTINIDTHNGEAGRQTISFKLDESGRTRLQF